MKRLFFTFAALLSFVVSNAQIGYQVALLNTATGEPRSNETVTCEIKLTNSEDAVVYEGKQKATSNDFGVVSLTVGDANTFSEMDWSKLPLTISVSVEGRLVGKTEVLTVPVAEHAKHYGTLTYENIGEKNVVCAGGYDIYAGSFTNNITFSNRRVSIKSEGGGINTTYEGDYFIDGNSIFGTAKASKSYGSKSIAFVGHYSQQNETVYVVIGERVE